MNQDHYWVHTWTAMPMLAEPDKLPPKEFVSTYDKLESSGLQLEGLDMNDLPENKIRDSIAFTNATIRQTIKITLGTDRFFRLRFSNAFGRDNLKISQASVAISADELAGTSRIQAHTLRNVTFDGGSAKTHIPGGALAVSDAIDFGTPLAANTILSISLFFEDGQSCRTGITCHNSSRSTSFCALGNAVSNLVLEDSSVREFAPWYYISGVEVLIPRQKSTLAIIGDSITDGRSSTPHRNDRWPDLLFTRLHADPATTSLSVISQAVGGNRILADGTGPNVLSRLDRDILAIPGLKYVVIFEGVNDIGVADANEESQREIGDQLIAGFQQIATRVHNHGLKIFAATITPFGRRKDDFIVDAEAEGLTGYSHPLREQTRQRINEWIRDNEQFDGVVDFDQILRDNEQPSVLASEFDSGDRLHPNLDAFHALANGFSLNLLK
ncbi:hypothetical protein N7478_008951 [Penicillium angulare]|uniref:uncharacterized protein n=1 Tax=Penicillium angulare TaxID=116970 RepID=UPI002540E783|nr:uncharacterized protein N7478_008951 [Penicillium angulare]KAJ5273826.1 hypothetical protein N7478_008951 [Penicillium angulare]